MQSKRLDLQITDEISRLAVTILGIATSIGKPRGINAKAAEAIENNSYPSESELIFALDDFE